MDAMQFPDDSGHGTSRWLPLYHGLLIAALGTGIAIGAAVRPATPSEAAPAAWRINPSSQTTDRRDQRDAHVLQPAPATQ